MIIYDLCAVYERHDLYAVYDKYSKPFVSHVYMPHTHASVRNLLYHMYTYHAHMRAFETLCITCIHTTPTRMYSKPFVSHVYISHTTHTLASRTPPRPPNRWPSSLRSPRKSKYRSSRRKSRRAECRSKLECRCLIGVWRAVRPALVPATCCGAGG